MKPFYAQLTEETLAALKTAAKSGLSSSECDARLKQYGLNKVIEKDAVRWPLILLRQFTNFFILILATAAVLSYFLGDLIDSLAILAIVMLNGFLGFAQEWKAETALKGLKKCFSLVARFFGMVIY